MKKHIDGLIKDINNQLQSSQLSSKDKRKLRLAKKQLKENSDFPFDSQTILNVLQALAIIVEMLKEISPHLK